MEPPCEQQRILKERWRADFRVYVQVTAGLEGLEGPDFEKAYDRAERARLAFERAREELHRHIRQHGC